MELYYQISVGTLRLLDEACTADDLATVKERAKACARKLEKIG